MSSIVNCAFSSAFFVAGTGPIPITLGSTPPLAFATIVAIGFIFNSSALRRLIRRTAAAPSFIPDAFPAVTVPSFLKAGFNFASDSTVVPCRIYSSESNIIGSPLR